MLDIKAIGRNLRILREGTGCNRQRIAMFLDAKYSLISKIETGERIMSADMLDKLASFYGVATTEILNKVVEPKPLPDGFRCSDLSYNDMMTICRNNKIMLNAEFMSSLLERKTPIDNQ